MVDILIEVVTPLLPDPINDVLFLEIYRISPVFSSPVSITGNVSPNYIMDYRPQSASSMILRPYSSCRLAMKAVSIGPFQVVISLNRFGIDTLSGRYMRNLPVDLFAVLICGERRIVM